MGNKLARTTQVSPSEYYLHDLPSSYNLVLKEALGGGRFLKSVQCVHDEGLLLVKVYFKRGEFPDLKVLLFSLIVGFKGVQYCKVSFCSYLETLLVTLYSERATALETRAHGRILLWFHSFLNS